MGFIDKIKGIFTKASETVAQQQPVTGYHEGGFTTTTTASGRTVLKMAPQSQNIPVRTAEGKRIIRAFASPPARNPPAHSTNAQRQAVKRLVDDIRTVPGSRAPTGLNRQQRRALAALQRKAQ